MGKKKENQVTTQQTQLPQWVNDASQSNYQLAVQTAQNLPGPYSGPRVAGMTGDQKTALNRIVNDVGSSARYYQNALSAAGGNQNYNAQAVQSQYDPNSVSFNFDPASAGSFLTGNLDAYMNPYIQNVERYAMDALNDQRLRGLNDVADANIRNSGGWGSRMGVLEGVTNAESARAAGALSAGLRADAYNNARGLQESDMNRAFQAAQFGATGGYQAQLANEMARQQAAQMGLTAQQYNQQADLQAAGIRQTSAGQLADITNSMTAAKQAEQQAAVAAAEQFQRQRQAQLDAQAAQAAAERQHEIDKLNIQMAALGMSPYGTTTTSTTPVTSSPFLTGLGVATGVGGLLI